MSPLAIRRRLTGLRGGVVAALCVLALGGIVTAHHSGLDGAPGMDMGASSMTHPAPGPVGPDAVAMVMCLAVLGLAVATLAALPAFRRTQPVRSMGITGSTGVRLRPRGGCPARAGPALFLRLEVLRR